MASHGTTQFGVLWRAHTSNKHGEILPSIDQHIRQQQYQPKGDTSISTSIRVHHAQKYQFRIIFSLRGQMGGGGTWMRNSDEWLECSAFPPPEQQHTTRLSYCRNLHPSSSAPSERKDGSHRSSNRSAETLINEWTRGQFMTERSWSKRLFNKQLSLPSNNHL